MTPDQQKARLVLGLGNDLFWDDGVGLMVVRRLRDLLDSSIDCLEVATCGLGLMDYLVGYEQVIIIDAILQKPEQAGQIFEWGWGDGGGIRAISPHYMGLSEIKKMAERLALPFPREIKVLAIAVKGPLTIGQGMSPEVEGAIERVIEMTKKIISTWQNIREGAIQSV